MIENNPEFRNAIVFVPRCAICGIKVINEDEIERGEVVEAYVQDARDLAVPESRLFDSEHPRPIFKPVVCPRCKTVFDKIVLPLKIIKN